MQVFDLTALRGLTGAPRTFSTVNRYTAFGNSHNLVINEDTNFVYVVGTARTDAYNGGVHFLDIQDPQNPTATCETAMTKPANTSVSANDSVRKVTR